MHCMNRHPPLGLKSPAGNPVSSCDKRMEINRELLFLFASSSHSYVLYLCKSNSVVFTYIVIKSFLVKI